MYILPCECLILANVYSVLHVTTGGCCVYRAVYKRRSYATRCSAGSLIGRSATRRLNSALTSARRVATISGVWRGSVSVTPEQTPLKVSLLHQLSPSGSVNFKHSLLFYTWYYRYKMIIITTRTTNEEVLNKFWRNFLTVGFGSRNNKLSPYIDFGGNRSRVQIQNQTASAKFRAHLYYCMST